jgi:hypothetical protein
MMTMMDNDDDNWGSGGKIVNKIWLGEVGGGGKKMGQVQDRRKWWQVWVPTAQLPIINTSYIATTSLDDSLSLPFHR